ncbi:MAG: HU family DNA-binding protein [Pseudanabaenaceae cyanobacterium]
MADLNRRDIIQRMMLEVDGLTHNMAAASLEAVLTAISQALLEHKTVVFQDFGKFGVRWRAARQTVHPQTQKLVQIPAVPVPYFSPSPKLKNLVAGK